MKFVFIRKISIMERTKALDAEIRILSTTKNYSSLTEGPFNEVVGEFCDGNYGAVLQQDFSKQLFKVSADESVEDLETLLQTNLANYLATVTGDQLPHKELELLLIATSCLQLFVQNNWLGPRPTLFTPKQLLPECIQGDKLMVYLEDQLSVDGEPLYGLAIFPEFLYLANYILNFLQQKCTILHTVDWWLLRCTNIHQQVLDNKSNTLRETVIKLMDSVLKSEPIMSNDQYRSLQIEFHVEAGNLCHVYFLYREAQEHFNSAKKLAGLNVELTGAMGKRTRYQQTDKAQLLLKVVRETDVSSNNSNSSDVQVTSISQMPKNLNLEDDTVLDAINFSDEDGNTTTHVTDYEQALILGLMEDHRRSHASIDSFKKEEAEAYFNYVLSQIRSWSVGVAALLLRSRLEKGSGRRVDRSMRQIEVSKITGIIFKLMPQLTLYDITLNRVGYLYNSIITSTYYMASSHQHIIKHYHINIIMKHSNTTYSIIYINI